MGFSRGGSRKYGVKMIRIRDIRCSVKKVENKEAEMRVLKTAVAQKLRANPQQILDLKIYKKALDARRKADLLYTYTLDVQVQSDRVERRALKMKGVQKIDLVSQKQRPVGSQSVKERPVVVGLGPSGCFAALVLAEAGYRPLVLERGAAVQERVEDIRDFWQGGSLKENSNVQFGEGGAGTFSDGKLTTRISDPHCLKVLESYVQAGAPEEILYLNKPHIGSDLLRKVVKNLREKIIDLGGEVRFNAQVQDLKIDKGHLTAIQVNDTWIATQSVLLGIGHSARDTFKMLYDKGLAMEAKPFAIGLRIEHPQEMIDRSQYGEFAGKYGLGAADYRLVYHGDNGRTAYSFCMCPGGQVVAATSERGYVVTNGMSLHARRDRNANAALLVGVTPKDFGSDHPLAGVDFQRKWEKAAYEWGGGNYCAPVQRVEDFLAGRPSRELGSVMSSYLPGVTPSDLSRCLPGYVVETLRKALPYFENKIQGFAMGDALLTGVETRSSSPVRLLRNADGQSNIKGLYPMGEGAGYAGGIMSSAVDGMRMAEGWMAAGS
jgi:uncharacterized FAD-dependent dehydrogenase